MKCLDECFESLLELNEREEIRQIGLDRRQINSSQDRDVRIRFNDGIRGGIRIRKIDHYAYTNNVNDRYTNVKKFLERI